TFAIQQRVLQLLRRLLPYLSPLTLHIQADDVYMGADSSRNASQLVGFFLDLLGRLVPPPPPSSSLPDHGISVPEKPTLKLHHGCGVEVVLLLRSLLLASEWAPLLQSVFLQALSPDSTGASTELSLSTFNRPIRVPLEDIAALPDVECKGGDLSQAFLKHLVESNLPHFLTSVLTDPINLSQDQPNENRDHLMGLLLGLVGFRALGSLVQSGDENDLVLRDCIPLLFQVATIHTQNPSDISLLEEHWVQRYKLWYDVQCPSGVDALDDASAPPSALCQQMMEMGFPREWYVHSVLLLPRS
ncbi:hypothetical protein DYB35_012572, partial [Aphanomyces astaci]